MGEAPVLPEGPVTVMFTDIEGSTALRTTLGDDASDALFHQHDDLVRKLIEAHGGHDLQAALGDGFLAVFVSTRRGIACAVAIQKDIERFNRGQPGPPLKVRIGLNTGEVAWQNGQPSGEAIHAASRVCAAAEGGEVFVSDVTRQLAGTLPDVTFTDRGDHDLKGFPQPWRLWSLAWRQPVPETPQDVFVGRDEEMGDLRKHLAASLGGRGGLVLVGGEPGVGKTTLVKQLIKEAEAKGALALFGRCYESEGAVPYSPFVEMLEQALRVVPPEWVREDMGEDAAEVARMVPELRRRFPDVGDPLELPPEQQRRYFFNAVSNFIGRGAQRLPLLLVMDDVHWADEPTLLLLEHVAEHITKMPILGVGTYRDVELEVSRPLAASLERLLRARIATRIPVHRFDMTGVKTMIGALASREPPQVLVDAIYSETEGNPFFVEEVFRHLVEEGKVFDEDGNFRSDIEIDELDVPESVRLVVGRRLDRLGPEAQKVLAAGAVVGRRFDFGLLERITDVDPDTLLDVIDEAERAKVVVPEQQGGDIHYTFAHELIRQTLLSGLSLPRRQRLHLRVADGILAVDPQAETERAAEIARHLMQAGAAAELDRTVDFLLRAADRAIAAAAFEDALRLVSDGLSLIEGSNEALRVRLLEKLGLAERALGRFEDCLEVWNEVVDHYERRGEGERAGDLLYEMAYQLAWLGRFEEAFALYARGLSILGDQRSVEAARLRAGAATLAGFAGFLEPSESQFAEAEAIVIELAEERTLGQIEWGRCVVYWCHLRVTESIEHGRRAVELLRKVGDLWTLADALAWLSFPLDFSGAADEGASVAREGQEIAAKVGHQGAEILAGRGVAFAQSLSSPKLEESKARAELDLERMRSIGSPWVTQSYAWLSAMATLLGDLDEGLRRADEAIAVEPQSAWSGVGLGFRLLNRAMANDTDECRRMLDEIIGPLPEPGSPITMGPLVQWSAVAEASAMLGWGKRCEDIYPFLVAVCRVTPMRVFDAALHERIAGMVASTLGEWEAAEGHFDRAIALVDELPNVVDDPSVRFRFGEMMLRRGRPQDRDRAREIVASARETFRARGMKVYASSAEALLEQI